MVYSFITNTCLIADYSHVPSIMAEAWEDLIKYGIENHFIAEHFNRYAMFRSDQPPLL